MHTQKREAHSRRALWLGLLLVPLSVHADDPRQHVVYDRARGELSVGTEAPTPAHMVTAIESASAGALTAMLEYGERVECMECIPLLAKKLMTSGDPQVRRMAAWWLRRRPFGYARIAVQTRETLMRDADPVRRARAAEALGEFLDARGLPALTHAVESDAEVDVRLAAVRALGRLNARAGHEVLATALQDEDASVRRAALDGALRSTFWSQPDAVRESLSDADPAVRMRAAQVVGERKIDGASEALMSLLRDDEVAAVRKAAAWALGRVGDNAAQAAMRTAQEEEEDPGVVDALAIALRMKR